MKSFLLSALLLSSLSFICSAQSINAKTETVKVSGNCGMCESTIEKSGSAKNKAKVDWDRDTHMATITYNPEKTSMDEILKRIATAGYDNEVYLAPDEAYNNLSGCCQYDRTFKTMSASVTNEMPVFNSASVTIIVSSQLQPVYDAYFALKDALVNNDGVTASANGASLLAALKAIDGSKLDTEEQKPWTKTHYGLINDAEKISQTKEILKQRNTFITLSTNMYLLMKTSKLETPVYYQHCPMANDGKGADWLSKESGIKNPYYGSRMLTCGSTLETLK